MLSDEQVKDLSERFARVGPASIAAGRVMAEALVTAMQPVVAVFQDTLAQLTPAQRQALMQEVASDE